MNTICRSFFCSLYLSISCHTKKMASMVDLPGMKPNWFLVTHVILLTRCSMTLSHSFIVWLINLIPRYLVQLWTSPLFLKIDIIYSASILQAYYLTEKWGWKAILSLCLQGLSTPRWGYSQGPSPCLLSSFLKPPWPRPPGFAAQNVCSYHQRSRPAQW